jgi:hypothetical protein
MLDEEECRRYARKFLMRSCQMNNPDTKAAMVEIALFWAHMAAQAAGKKTSAAQQDRFTLRTDSPSLVPE